MKPARQASPKRTANVARKEAPAAKTPPVSDPWFTDEPPVQAKCVCGGGCPSCKDDLQTRLEISSPEDAYEQEADRVAEQVMRAAAPSPSEPPATPKLTPLLQRQEAPGEDEQEEEPVELQMTRSPGAATEGTPPDDTSLEKDLSSLRGRGQPLPDADRTWFEQRFGRDFSGVRIHSGGRADRAARTARALAFTSGHDIVFRGGQYAPQNASGRNLIAHELAHVVQQGRAPPAAAQNTIGPSGPRGPPATIPPLRFLRRCVVQRAPAGAAAVAVSPYKPVHKGPVFGTLIHVDILEKLRDANPELVTEAPVPGTNKSLAGHTHVGEADLYMSAPPPSKIAGIKGMGSGTANPLVYDSFTGTAFRPPAVKKTPTFVSGAFTGEFVKDFFVGDLKPASRSQVLGGNKQLKNYIGHHREWAKKLIDAGLVSGDAPTGHVLPAGAGAGQTVKVPDNLNYRKFATENNNPGGLIKGTERMWVFDLTGHPGVFLYFDLPATFTEADIAAKLQMLEDHLARLNKPLTEKPAKIQKKTAPDAGRAPPRTVQRKVPPADLAEWKSEQHKWSVHVSKAFTDNAGTVRKLFFDDLFNLNSSQKPGAGRLIAKLDLWAGTSGTLLGELGWRFRGAIAKFHPFFERVKKKFKEYKEEAQTSVKPSTGRSWVNITFNSLLAVAKLVFQKLLDHTVGLLAGCVNGMVDGAFNLLLEQFENLDLVQDAKAEIDKLLQPVQDVIKLFDEFEAKAGKLFTDLDTEFAAFLAFLKESPKIIGYIQTLRWAFRLIMQAISCGTPPAWGCLWGLVGQIFLDELLTQAMRFIRQTKKYQELVNDLACTMMKTELKQWYGGILRGIIEEVGLAEFAGKVQAPCKFDEKDTDFDCDLPASGVEESEYGKLRSELESDTELMDKAKEDTWKRFDLVPGVPASENDVQQFLLILADQGVPIELIAKCIDDAIEGDRVNLQKVLQCVLTTPPPPPPPPPPPSVAGGGKGGKGKGDGAGSSGEGTADAEGGSSEEGKTTADQGPAEDGAGSASAGKPPEAVPPDQEPEGAGEVGGGIAGGTPEGGSAGAQTPEEKKAERCRLLGECGLTEAGVETAEALIRRMLEHLNPNSKDAVRLRELQDSLRKKSRLRKPTAAPLPTDPGFVSATPSSAPPVQTKCACGGGCPACEQKGKSLQAQVEISTPGDPYEREADLVADEVMRKPAGDNVPVGSHIQRFRSPEGAQSVSRPRVDPLHAIRSGGRGLPSGERTWFEQRFGRDFGSVRIHDDSRADAAARDLNALAFTSGSDIALRSDQYAPGTASGRRLLAHELTHVVQQGSARTPNIQRVPAADPDNPERAEPQERTDPLNNDGPVQRVVVSCEEMRIILETLTTRYIYTLTSCSVPSGTYETTVKITGNEVFLDPGEQLSEEDEFYFNFSLKRGQDNPATLLKHQSSVRVEVVKSLPKGEPNAGECFMSIDDYMLLEPDSKQATLFDPVNIEIPVWERKIPLAEFGWAEVEAIARAEAEGDVEARHEGVRLTDICMVRSIDANRVGGRARIRFPASLDAIVTAKGGLRVSAEYLSLIPVAAVDGNLIATGKAHLEGLIEGDAEVLYDRKKKQWFLTAKSVITGSAEVSFDLDAEAAVEVLTRTIWKQRWKLLQLEAGIGWQAGLTLLPDRSLSIESGRLMEGYTGKTMSAEPESKTGGKPSSSWDAKKIIMTVIDELLDEEPAETVTSPARDGLKPESALPFHWHKPKEDFLYPREMEFPNATPPVTVDRDNFPATVYYESRGRTLHDNFGVADENWPYVGRKFQLVSEGRSDREKDRFRRLVDNLGYVREGVQIDHVHELQFGRLHIDKSPDSFDNLWPLSSDANGSAGARHRNQLRRYEKSLGNIQGRWFEIVKIGI